MPQGLPKLICTGPRGPAASWCPEWSGDGKVEAAAVAPRIFGAQHSLAWAPTLVHKSPESHAASVDENRYTKKNNVYQDCDPKG